MFNNAWLTRQVVLTTILILDHAIFQIQNGLINDQKLTGSLQ